MTDEAASAIVTGSASGRHRPFHSDATWKSLARRSSNKLLQGHGHAGLLRLFEPHRNKLTSWIDMLRESISVLLTLFYQGHIFPNGNAVGRPSRH
jgi:hypothetical protein